MRRLVKDNPLVEAVAVEELELLVSHVAVLGF